MVQRLIYKHIGTPMPDRNGDIYFVSIFILLNSQSGRVKTDSFVPIKQTLAPVSRIHNELFRSMVPQAYNGMYRECIVKGEGSHSTGLIA